jgi:hypothetical protein
MQPEEVKAETIEDPLLQFFRLLIEIEKGE